MEDSKKLAPMIVAIKTIISKTDGGDSLKMKEVKDVSNGLIQLMNEHIKINKKVHCALLKDELEKITKKTNIQNKSTIFLCSPNQRDGAQT